MLEIINETQYKPNENFLSTIAAAMSDRDVELTFTTNKNIQEMNKVTRDIDKPTDVLSFPLESIPHVPMGEIVISVEYAQKKSSELGHGVDDEIALLFIHGMLHLLGYDHENDDGQMRAKEAELIKYFALPESLIVRNGS